MGRDRLHDETRSTPDLRRVRQIANLMDDRFRIPGTKIRFGFDTLLGLLPVVGDTVGTAIGVGIVMEALRLRVGSEVITKMAANLAIDWAVGLVPFADLVLDTWYKANVRNVALLEEAIRARTGA